MCKDTITQIDTLIRSRTPIIAIESPEEARIISEVKLLLRRHNQAGGVKKALVSWSISRGFVPVEPEGDPIPAPDPVQALLKAAGIAGQTGKPEPTVYIFQDIHPYLERVPQALRALRDAAGTLANNFSTIILLSPSVKIPDDARKDVRVITFPLPSAWELEEQLDAFVSDLPDGIEARLADVRDRLIRALQGLTRVEADQVLAQAAITHRCLDERAIEFVLSAKAQIIKESGALEYFAEKASYAEIGGLDLLKMWAREAEQSATPEAKEFGIEPPRGVLLVGVPGCGKSLTAKAIAGANRPLLRLDVGALFGSLVGQSEAQTRQALKVAEAVAPAVLWIDEIEKALGGSSGGELDGGTSTRVLGTILTWMQESKADVFVVATANDISSLRPELVRRFDETFFVDLPTDQERREILSIHLAKRARNAADFDLDAVVAATEDYTGSELEKIVKGALRRAFVAGRTMTTEDLLSVVAQTVRLVDTMADGIAAMRNWATRARPASSVQETGYQPAAASVSAGLEFR